MRYPTRVAASQGEFVGDAVFYAVIFACTQAVGYAIFTTFVLTTATLCRCLRGAMKKSSNKPNAPGSTRLPAGALKACSVIGTPDKPKPAKLSPAKVIPHHSARTPG
ncbi:MAG: hypothetical protein R3C68_01975 [Myxococcota bacterium]